MRYTEPLSYQLMLFFGSLGPGAVIGFLYDVPFCFLRKLSENKVHIFLWDILFCILSTFTAFFYMVIFGNAFVRLHMLFALITGAFAFHFALGRYLFDFSCRLALKVRKIFLVLCRPFILIFRKTVITPLKKLSERGRKVLKNKKITFSRKKVKNILKIHLKK